MHPTHRAQLFGGLRVWIPREGQTEDEVTGWRSERTRALLAYLLLHTDRNLPREEILEAVWGECGSGEGSRRGYLNLALHDIRHRMNWDKQSGSPLYSDRKILRLDGACIPSDYSRFRQLVRRADRESPADAVQRWRDEIEPLVRLGAPLPEFFDEWARDAQDAVAADCSRLTQRALEQAGNAQGSVRSVLDTAALDADAFAEFVRDTYPLLFGTEQAEWFRKLQEQDLRSLYIAEWETRQDAAPRILVHRSVRAVWGASRLGEVVLAMLRKNLEVRGCVTETCRPYAHWIAGSLAIQFGEYRLAKRYLNLALKEFKRRNDRHNIVNVLANLGNLADKEGDRVTHLRIAEELAPLHIEQGEFGVASQSLGAQAVALREMGCPARALQLLDRALELAHEVGDVHLQVHHRLETCVTLWRVGRRDAALRMIRQVQQFVGRFEIPSERHAVGKEHGQMLAEIGDLPGSVAVSVWTLEGILHSGRYPIITECLRWTLRHWNHCPVAQARPVLDTFARIVGAEAALRDRHNLPLLPSERTCFPAACAALRTQLTPRLYRAAVLAGRRLSEAEVLALLRSAAR